MNQPHLGLSVSKPRSPDEWRESGILTDFQIEALQNIADDSVLLEALEKIICYELVAEGVFKNNLPFDAGQNFILSYVQGMGGVINNERLGEDVRTLFWGVLRLKEGLNNIKNFSRLRKVVVGDENPAV